VTVGGAILRGRQRPLWFPVHISDSAYLTMLFAASLLWLGVVIAGLFKCGWPGLLMFIPVKWGLLPLYMFYCMCAVHESSSNGNPTVGVLPTHLSNIVRVSHSTDGRMGPLLVISIILGMLSFVGPIIGPVLPFAEPS
jgi:hypothetical protein